jgi:hypothetical protein
MMLAPDGMCSFGERTTPILTPSIALLNPKYLESLPLSICEGSMFWRECK